VPGSVPVSLCGSDMEVYLIINPSGVYPASRLCLPLPYLRCQVTPSVPTKNSVHTFTHMLPPQSHCMVRHLYLPSHPVFTGTMASHEKLLPWYHRTFIFFPFIHMHIKCLGHFSPTPPSPSPFLPPHFQAESVLPLSLILLKREYKQ
jgi:hypothetical protein